MAKIPLQSECLQLFGNPSSKGWQSKNTVRVPVPWAMSMGTIPIRSIEINKIAADSLAKVLTKIWNRCGQNQSKIHAAGCDCFSRSFAVRLIRGGSMPSSTPMRWRSTSTPRTIRSARLRRKRISNRTVWSFRPSRKKAGFGAATGALSKTLEYAYDDWCIAQMAQLLNKTDDYTYFIKRSQNWQNVFDWQTGFMRPKKNGGWDKPFDPK